MAVRSAGLVADLWRFPVKSFGGERVREIFVGPYGFHGDRRFAAIGGDGAVLTARRKTGMLGFRARFPDPDRIDQPLVTGPDGLERPVDDPDLADALGTVVGQSAQMAASGIGVFDAAPIHIVTDRSLRQMDEWVGEELDVARFRPNIVIELADGFGPFCEADWVGARIEIGQALVEVVSPTERCVITTVDPDTLDRDRAVLARLATERQNLFGVYGRVLRPGWTRIGDPVLLSGTARAGC